MSNVHSIESTAALDVDDFVQTASRLGMLSLVLVLVLVVDAAMMWGENVWAALISLIVAGAQFVVAGTLTPRLKRREELQNAGNVVVQHSWLLLSIAIAALAIYPSPFFAVSMLWFAVAMLVSLAWGVIGAFNLYRSITQAGARLTV